LRRRDDDALEVGNQPIAKRQPFSRDRLDVGAESPRLAFADSVHPDMRAEHRRLQPAYVELARWRFGAVETADVRTVIRAAAHSPRQAASDRRRKRFPIALRIAAPAERIALASSPCGAAPDDGGTV